MKILSQERFPERRLSMKRTLFYTSIFTCTMLVTGFACNRRQNYQPNDHAVPLNTPMPVPEGAASDPAAASPGARTEELNSKAAGDTLPDGYVHCPPQGVTPPSATTTANTGGADISPVDCPPGDPNASTYQIGIPGSENSDASATKPTQDTTAPSGAQNADQKP
jgi:hypothetical protein